MALIQGATIDWAFILDQADKHRLFPVMYSTVKNARLQSFLPDFAMKKLTRRYFGIVGYNLGLCKKLMEVLALLNGRNIPALPVKGAVLSHMLYGDSALRVSMDMDILVPKRCVAPARDALLSSGFSSRMGAITGKQFEQVLKYGREYEFLDQKNKYLLDLHWELGGPFRLFFDYGFCEDRMRTIRFQGRDVLVLSTEDTLLHLCVNGSCDIWQSMEQALCVAKLVERYPHLDWNTVTKLAEQKRCGRMLFTGLFLARDLFGISLPEKIAYRVETEKNVAGVVDRIYVRLLRGANRKSHMRMRAAQLPYYLAMRESLPEKVLYLLRRIFVPTTKDWRNRVAHPKFPFLCFLTRPYDLMSDFLEALKPLESNSKTGKNVAA